MAGYFSIGERKIRPGAYFNVQSGEEGNSYGAIDGVVAVLFRSSMGPLGVVKELQSSEGYVKTYGTGGTTAALEEVLQGGAVKLVACRIGSGGAAGSAELTAENGKVVIASKYPGAVNLTVTVRTKLVDAARKECIIYLDETEFEKVSFTAGGDEAAALVNAMATSKNFTATGTDASGVITNVSQVAFTGGEDPTVTNGDYSAALTEIEKYYFNVVCVDTEDASVHTLVAEFLKRIYDSGKFGMATIASAQTLSLEERMEVPAGFDAENMIYVLNTNVNTGTEDISGYKVAAHIAGIVASTPSNRSVTHMPLRYALLNERLTNGEMEAAEEKGCLVLSTASDGTVWLDNGINTLINPDENHDNGWKKIRRVRARYELLYRANAAADALVGKVDNDTNGRATILSAIQAVGNDMEAEGKLQYVNVTESTNITPDGDTCGFDIEVIDLDSAEHIYLTYYFQFSTAVTTEG